MIRAISLEWPALLAAYADGSGVDPAHNKAVIYTRFLAKFSHSEV